MTIKVLKDARIKKSDHRIYGIREDGTGVMTTPITSVIGINNYRTRNSEYMVSPRSSEMHTRFSRMFIEDCPVGKTTDITLRVEFQGMSVDLEGINIKSVNHFDQMFADTEATATVVRAERTTSLEHPYYMHIGCMYGEDGLYAHGAMRSVDVSVLDKLHALLCKTGCVDVDAEMTLSHEGSELIVWDKSGKRHIAEVTYQ